MSGERNAIRRWKLACRHAVTNIPLFLQKITTMVLRSFWALRTPVLRSVIHTILGLLRTAEAGSPWFVVHQVPCHKLKGSWAFGGRSVHIQQGPELRAY
jgi:hypothetical protein